MPELAGHCERDQYCAELQSQLVTGNGAGSLSTGSGVIFHRQKQAPSPAGAFVLAPAAPSGGGGLCWGAAVRRKRASRDRLLRRRSLSPWSGDQTFTLCLFTGELARSADCLGFLPSRLLRWLLIESSPLHLTKDAFPLHLLLEDSKGLVDVVVAHKYLQRNTPSVVVVVTEFTAKLRDAWSFSFRIGCGATGGSTTGLSGIGAWGNIADDESIWAFSDVLTMRLLQFAPNHGRNTGASGSLRS
jgi:hypothetical protein